MMHQTPHIPCRCRRAATCLLSSLCLALPSPAIADGTLAWRLPLQATYAAHPGVVASDGTVYVQDVQGTVYAVAPSGTVRWTYPTGGIAEGPLAIGTDGTIYAGGDPLGGNVNIYAINPDGSTRWVFTDPGVTPGIIAGPAVGPDGNVYAVTEIGGLGVFSLSGATGQLRWNDQGSPNFNERGQTGAGIAFGPRTPAGVSDQLYIAFDMNGTAAGTGLLFAYSLGGSRRLQFGIGGDANVGQFAPAAGIQTGSVLVSSLNSAQGYRLRSYSAESGSPRWSYPSDAGAPTNFLTQPTVGPDGTVYIMRNLGQIHAVDQSGGIRWIHTTSYVFNAPVPSPTGSAVVVGGRTTFGEPGFIKGLNVQTGSLLWTINLPDEAGVHMIPMSRPWFSPDGRRAYITTTLPGSTANGYLYAVDVQAPACRADFDADGTLAVQDIFAYLAAWFAGAPSADFTGGGLSVQDIFDYLEAWFSGC